MERIRNDHVNEAGIPEAGIPERTKNALGTAKQKTVECIGCKLCRGTLAQRSRLNK